jgi:iron complex outermembrane receptor protein
MPGRSFGVELESAISVGRLGKFNASLVRLDTKLDGLNGFYVGVPFPNSPKWQLKAGFEQGINLPTGILSARADLRVVSSQVVFPETTIVPTTHPSVQDKYSTGDLSIAYRPHNDRYSITAYLKNVNDEFIKQSHFFGYSQLAAPRTFGVSGMVKF